jgi:imidazolonepropionase
MAGAAAKEGRKVDYKDLSILSSAALVADEGRITWIGQEKNLPATKADQEIDLKGAVVLPAFSECHTHLAFAGNRAEEFEWRQQGMSYLDIARKGGGIVSTVNATRATDENDLVVLMQKRADRFVEQGVTTLEIKSGYGLDVDAEIRSLTAAGRVEGPRIVRTFLGPHAKPPEIATYDEYFEHVIENILPQIVRYRLADRADIFIEQNFFTPSQGQRYFEKAKSLGLDLTAHVEQLTHSGGMSMAMKYDPVSVDHVIQLHDSEITALAKSNTTAVLLPASDFYLKMKYPPARALIDQGARVALSTDFNPGTSPTQDLSFIGVLARIEMKMTLPEVLAGWIIGSAYALKKQADVGSLEVGKSCDFICLGSDWRTLFYSVGDHPVTEVWKDGKKLFEKKF